MGAVVAIIGALAAVNPTNAVLPASAKESPRLAAALPPVIAVCGAPLTAVSEPPGAMRRR